MNEALDLLKSLAPRLRSGIAVCGVPNAYLNPVNAAARIATGKWRILDSSAFVSGQGMIHVIPGEDKQAYYRSIVLHAMTGPVANVPAYMADHLRKQPALKVSKSEVQYVIPLERMQTLPGGDLKRLRQYVNKVTPQVEITHYGKGSPLTDVPVKELLEVNRVWYREAQDRFFRTSEKTQIDWLIENWPTMVEIDPFAVLTVTRERETGLALSFNIGTQLYAGMSCTIVERYVREGPRNANLVGLISHMGALGEPLINDGPGGSKDIEALKEKFSGGNGLTFYSVERRGR